RTTAPPATVFSRIGTRLVLTEHESTYGNLETWRPQPLIPRRFRPKNAVQSRARRLLSGSELARSAEPGTWFLRRERECERLLEFWGELHCVSPCRRPRRPLRRAASPAPSRTRLAQCFRA